MGSKVEEALAVAEAIRGAIGTVIEGKPDVVELALVSLLAEGHLLIEDVPGVGKTMLAKSLARAAGGSSQRIQFTPDLLPSDITGVSIFDTERRAFEFRPGGIFANIVVGDEINRASPKTQSALLEAMEERHVSVDGVTHALPRPFMVVATQNPIEMEGTYPLPEAQRDRFLLRIAMGYPSAEAESAMLEHHQSRSPLDDLEPVATVEEVRRTIEAVHGVYVHQALKDYLVAVVGATRHHEELRLGASPRASLQLLRAAKARAVLRGRHYVTPDDIIALAEPALAHRVLLTAEAQFNRRSVAEVIAAAVAGVPVPDKR